jgi:hypothetical protein
VHWLRSLMWKLLAAMGRCAAVVLAACDGPVHRATRIPAAQVLRAE